MRTGVEPLLSLNPDACHWFARSDAVGQRSQSPPAAKGDGPIRGTFPSVEKNRRRPFHYERAEDIRLDVSPRYAYEPSTVNVEVVIQPHAVNRARRSNNSTAESVHTSDRWLCARHHG
jgi:hypothetical protein